MPGTVTRRRFLGFGTALGGTALLGGTAVLGAPATPARAAGGRAAGAGPRAAGGGWPSTLHLPDGFHPAGIAIGALPYAYFGSLLGGAIYRVGLATGQGRTVHPGHDPGTFDPDHMAVGLQVDRRGRLFVGGGWGRVIRVFDAASGAVLRSYPAGVSTTAVAHVALTPRAVWFTDGFNALLFGLPLGPRGELPATDEVITLPLTGDWVQGPASGPTGTGIAPTPDGRALLVVNALADGGGLFRVDPATGVARRVALGGATFPTTNGITVHGRTLYAPAQFDVAVIRLDRAGTSGAVVERVTDPRFDTPCAAQVYAGRLYLTNSRFGVEPTPQTEYTAVSVPLPRG